MRRISWILLIVAILPLYSLSQEKKEEPKFGISFSGFIKTDIFYDSRQTVNIREGHFLLYPDNESLDQLGRDINAKSSFNILSIQSRLKGTITAPDAFGAKTSGVLEADFFGNENSNFSDLNGFRLRHAFAKLNWKTSELLVGQYWHPMFIAESFPGVISFNTGAPFQPFSRNPQIRFTKTFGSLKMIGCLYSQRDFTSIGPEYTSLGGVYNSTAIASSKYLRNSRIPNAHFQIQFVPDSTEHLFGVGVDYKTILPELYTVDVATKTEKYESSKTINSLSWIAYAKLKFKSVVIKFEGVLAQNAYDMVMLGGYAVSKITEPLTGVKDFTNLRTGAFWLDANTTGKMIQFGLFAGYTKNLGSTDNITTTLFYARGSNIDNVYRVAPRVTFISGKVDLAVELEHTAATYGKANGDAKGGVTDGKAIANTRCLIAFVYKF